jgi:hypothetical protein
MNKKINYTKVAFLSGKIDQKQGFQLPKIDRFIVQKGMGPKGIGWTRF